MKRLTTIVSSLLVLGLLTLALEGCDQATIDPSQSGEIELTEELMAEIWASPEHARILDLQRETVMLADAAFLRGVMREEFLEAAAKGNVEGSDPLLDLFFDGSTRKGQEFVSRVLKANQALIDKYPVLLQVQTVVSSERGCSAGTDTVEMFFTRFEQIKEFTLGGGRASKTLQEGPTCGSYWQQAKLLSCATLCGVSTSGFGAILCGWACWCWFCDENSEISDEWC